jgi:hypothetical protein
MLSFIFGISVGVLGFTLFNRFGPAKINLDIKQQTSFQQVSHKMLISLFEKYVHLAGEYGKSLEKPFVASDAFIRPASELPSGRQELLRSLIFLSIVYKEFNLPMMQDIFSKGVIHLNDFVDINSEELAEFRKVILASSENSELDGESIASLAENIASIQPYIKQKYELFDKHLSILGELGLIDKNAKS